MADMKAAFYNLIIDAMQTKIKEHPSGAILVMQCAPPEDPCGILQIIRQASEEIKHTPGWERWTFCLIDLDCKCRGIFFPAFESLVKGLAVVWVVSTQNQESQSSALATIPLA
jgi:hypothetical protein